MKKRTYAAVLALAGMGAVTTTGVAGETPMVAFAASYPTVSIGSHGSTVVYLQNRLNALGYSCGKADGIFGPKTLAAVKKFQKAKHLTVDGIVGPKTWAALTGSTSSGGTSGKSSSSQSSSKSSTVTISSTPTLREGSSGSAVKTLQTALNQLGYSCGTVDGVFGSKTLSAVKKFQKAKGLVMDGVVGPKTWAALKSALGSVASRGGTPPTSVTTGSSSGSSGSSSSGSTSSGSSSSGSKSSGSSSSGSSSSNQGPAYPGTVLKVGSQGTAVKEVQQKLNELGYSCGTVDGDFGPKTESAVKAFQKAKKLTVDGQVGPATWSALFNVKVTTSNPYTNVDLRYSAPKSVTASQIDQWVASNHPGNMEGLGTYFIEAQNKYGTNATYLLAHAALETGWGSSWLATQKNNWFGYGAYDRDANGFGGTFPSSEYAILFEAWEVRQNYLTPGASNYHDSPTLTGMNANYATSSTWADSIGDIMGEYVSETGGSASDYVQYQASNDPPAPASSTEPVYKVSTNSVAQVAPNSPYSALPVFSSLSDDAAGSFLYGTLSQTSSSVSYPSVKKLQQRLNDLGYSCGQVDGEFGPKTTSALKQFQAAHGLSKTGVCDDATWAKLFPATGTALQKGKTYHIDEMAQFMTDGMEDGIKQFVTLWYHVVGYGWVPSTEVQLNNVYQVIPAQGYTLKLTGSAGSVTLHRGDFAVKNSSGQLEVYNQSSGKLIVGKPSASYTLQQFKTPVVHSGG
ncbi:peptidoglycan-binding protein [Alicyclobacillus shizuokensis]|uniref:peptidoglycan-binding protein n=1 Tax=Alicyclobacillus shizuokensis TaxID=392014 RepID=UPI00082D31C1|nr:peptidoglycan-binding protein [Alicyclobacillus shizuokensis]